MVLSAVVTTSASSAAMNEATEVRARTAAFADLALESVMKSVPHWQRWAVALDASAPTFAASTNEDGQRIRGQNLFASPNPLAILGRLQQSRRLSGLETCSGVAADWTAAQGVCR